MKRSGPPAQCRGPEHYSLTPRDLCPLDVSLYQLQHVRASLSPEERKNKKQVENANTHHRKRHVRQKRGQTVAGEAL